MDEPMLSSGVDPPSVDLVAREDSTNSESMSSSDSEPAFQDAQPLRQLLPKPGMDIAEHVQRLSPIESEEDGEPDRPIKAKDLRLSYYSVRQVMKKALPPGTKIMEEAKKDMQLYASEFISFITSEAAEKVHREHRRTILGTDILVAMENIGFEHYAKALRPYLFAYLENEKRNGSPVSETKDEDTDAAAVQNGETTESASWDQLLEPGIPTADDPQDTSLETSSSSFPWVGPSALDPSVQPCVLTPRSDDAE